MFLRRVRRSRWLGVEEIVWLNEGDAPADPLGDLQTLNNELSVWHIEPDSSNLNQTLAAITATRDQVANFDYALFDEELLSEMTISVAATAGGTDDEAVNGGHRDLIQLSAEKLVKLAKGILKAGEIKRVSEKSVLSLIAQAVDSGRLDLDNLKPGIRSKIQ